MTISLGERLLVTLSSRESMNEPSFKTLVKDLNVEGSLGENPSYFLWRTIRNFQVLGHLEVEQRKSTKYLYVCNSALLRLPYYGKPEYLLVGRRGVGVEGQLGKAMKKRGIKLRREVVEMGHDGLCPDKITLACEEEEGIHAFAAEFNVTVADGMPTIDIARSASSLEEYETTLEFLPQRPAYPEESVERFNRNSHKFEVAMNQSFESCRLERYPETYSRSKVYYFVNNNEEFAQVLPDWGRYLYMRSIRHHPFSYGMLRQELFAPPTAYLPILYDRALSLCSGKPSRTVRGSGLDSGLRYVCVPDEVTRLLQSKLGKVKRF
jgi:hypothetical protein